MEKYLSNFLFRKAKYADLGALAKFSTPGVEIFADSQSLRQDTEPDYLIVRYQGSPIALAYDSRLERQSVHFTSDRDNQRVQQIWSMLESYYS